MKAIALCALTVVLLAAAPARAQEQRGSIQGTIRDSTLSGEQAATVQLSWDQSYALNDGRRLRGKYGYYNVVQFVTRETSARTTSVCSCRTRGL